MPDLILIVSLLACPELKGGGVYAIATVGLYIIACPAGAERRGDRLHYRLAYQRWLVYREMVDALAAENDELRAEVLRLRKLARDPHASLRAGLLSEVEEILAPRGYPAGG